MNRAAAAVPLPRAGTRKPRRYVGPPLPTTGATRCLGPPAAATTGRADTVPPWAVADRDTGVNASKRLAGAPSLVLLDSIFPIVDCPFLDRSPPMVPVAFGWGRRRRTMWLDVLAAQP